MNSSNVSAISTLLSLHREYECWCDVSKFCSAPELKPVRVLAEGRKKHLRIMMVSQAKAICLSAKEYKKTGGLKEWAMRGDICDAFRTLGLWIKEKQDDNGQRA